jgi:uncharacterized lipoprotein YddW (UPF0748 family)
MPALLLLLACVPQDVPLVAPEDSAAETDATTDATTDPTDETDGPEPIVTVAVSHERELRALFVATVYNIDWPSSSSASASTQQAEIRALLDEASDAGFNAVVVQMRPEGDALYRSAMEPWSRSLTGAQGEDPGYDPLEVWIDEATARGIEVHAWLNPYRARAGSESASGLGDGHMARAFPEYAYGYSGDLWMDPASEEVRGRVLAVVEDLLTHYDLAGIHFDDYFYPYPDDGDFPDDALWDAYVDGGGDLSRDDWRRENTATLIREVSAAIRAIDPAVRFGVAPFGIWRPGFPAGITGFDPYEGLYADPLAWARDGDVDYLAPQLYWETTRTAQAYEPLATWWDAQLPDDVYLFPTNALYQLGSTSAWDLDELADQLAICRDPALTHTHGNLWYNASALLDDLEGVQAAFPTRYYPRPALPPPVHALAGLVEDPPRLSLDERTVSWDAAPGRRALSVYRNGDDGWTLDRLLPGTATEVSLPRGQWAIASVGAGDVESRGSRIDVR